MLPPQLLLLHAHLCYWLQILQASLQAVPCHTARLH
jgi:hypothetical protein